MSLEIEQNELDEILQEFFTEAEENLDQLEQDLIKLEALADGAGTDAETVNRLFRMLHTLKGGAGFLGLEKIGKLAHAGENLLDEVRTDKVAVSKTVIDTLLQTTDVLKTLLNMSKAREDDSGVDNTALIATLEALAQGGTPAAPTPEAPVKAPPKTTKKAAAKPTPKGQTSTVASPLADASLLDEVLGDDVLDPSRDTGEDPSMTSTPAAPVTASPLADANLLAEVLGDDVLDPSRDAGEEIPLPALPAATAAKPVAVPPPGQPEQRKDEPRRKADDDRRQQARRGNDEGGETIRVETARLDKVMNLVGELVLARNTLMRQLGNTATRSTIEQLPNAGPIYTILEQLSRVTQDIQLSVLSTRMQPIKKVFDKIPRQVRELKTQLGKEVNLTVEGELTEIDKTLVEELGDPMMHMIRNALDHGIETPAERQATGKHPEGTLTVRAFYEGSNVVIQVQEDGKGIDPNTIRNVAVKKGLISAEAAAALTDHAAIRLIMAPGFSTAAKITDVSGRGVGMDVVNTNIANMKGTLDIHSEYGVGTCFSIYLPLTLAIVNALVVEASGEGFAVPIGDIAEVIKFQPETRHKVNEMDMIELRGEPLQLFYLSSITRNGYNPTRYKERRIVEARPDLSLDDLEAAVEMALPTLVDTKTGKAPDDGYVLIVREGSDALGVVVDGLIGQEEVVVKGVTDVFEYHKAISGATITGDGKVQMILDIPFLMKNLAHTAA